MAPSLSLEALERAYSPSSCIGGNYAPHLAAYAERSASARAHHAVQRDLRYGDQAAQRLDLFLPPVSAADTAPPLLVFIHGGYWQELSKESSAFAAAGCVPAGIAFAAIGYTLAPTASVHAMALECRQALRWLHRHAETLGFDPARITVAGSSAGAHLAAMASLRGWPDDADLPAGLPAAAILVSGIYDLAPLVQTSINRPLGLDAATVGQVSPQYQPLRGFPPAVVCWGEIETDEFKRQSRDFAQAIAAGGGPAPVVFEIPARNHFDVILDLAEAGTPLGNATLGLIGPRVG